MGKWVIGALLAATAWTPMAQAQDGGGWRGRHGGDGQQSAQPQQGRGNWGGNRGAQAQPQAQVQPQAQPQVQQRVEVRTQADGGQRRGGWNGGGQVDAQTQARVQLQAQQGGGWQGRRDGQRPQTRARGDVGAQVYGQQNVGNRDRNGDGRPDAYARDRNGDGRPDAYNRGGRGYDAGNRQAFRNDGRGFDGRGYDNRNDGRWNNGWRRDNRYDWNGYRSYNRNAFRLPRYYAPYGWNYGYRRFSIGVVLSQSLFGQNYWIDDPYDYRLPEAYGPYRWVRYYNDALLIDVRSGVVVDTVYDIFW